MKSAPEIGRIAKGESHDQRIRVLHIENLEFCLAPAITVVIFGSNSSSLNIRIETRFCRRLLMETVNSFFG